MDEHTTPDEAGLSRRDVLKRAAVVGAAAWTAPIVSTFNAPAFAQTETSPGCQGVDYNCGDPIVTCGTAHPDTPGCGCCVCDLDIHGDPFCWNDALCATLPAGTCASNDDCPDGWACIPGTCCDVPKCFPPCGTLPPARGGDLNQLQAADRDVPLRSGTGR